MRIEHILLFSILLLGMISGCAQQQYAEETKPDEDEMGPLHYMEEVEPPPGTGEETEPAQDRSIVRPPDPEFTDAEILNAAYNGTSYIPGFYNEGTLQGNIYYENTISIKPPKERGLEWIELCTDNRTQALAWSEASSRNSAYYRNLTGERETDKYFEFTRVYAKNPSDVLLSRVHKCSYLDKSGYDKFQKEEGLGTFSQRPITDENAKELIEYLWYVEHPGAGSQNPILDHYLYEDGDSIRYVIYHVVGFIGDWGLCDQIALVRRQYSVDVSSGKITMESKDLRTVEGRCR